MWHKISAAVLISSTLATGLAQAQDPRFQDAVDSMKAQWQSGIPVAGIAALESLRPDTQIHKSVEFTLDQIVVALPRLMGSTTRSQSDNL
ncbi:MAG: hypothetical protein ACSHXK_11815 [Oceanococcus sp.]